MRGGWRRLSKNVCRNDWPTAKNQFFLFNFRFSIRKSQSQNKKDDLFYNTVSLKKPSFFLQTSTHLTWKIICSRNTANNRSDFANFQQTCFCLVSEKTFALHHFWTPKNCLFNALWMQVSVYFSLYSSKYFCSRDVVRFYLAGSALGGDAMISLRQIAVWAS